MNWNDSYGASLVNTPKGFRLDVTENMTPDKARLLIDGLTYHVIKNNPAINGDFYSSYYFEGDSEFSGLHDYDNQSKAFAKEHVDDRLEYFLNGDKSRKVLEIGCAFGHTVDELNSRGYTAYGLDISEYAIQKYKKDYKVRHDITISHLPVGADLIYSFAMMEHVAKEDIRKTIENIWFSLNKNGVYFATIDNMWGADLSHQTIMPREWWNGLFKDQGFTLDEKGTERFKSINGYVFRRPA